MKVILVMDNWHNVRGSHAELSSHKVMGAENAIISRDEWQDIWDRYILVSTKWWDRNHKVARQESQSGETGITKWWDRNHKVMRQESQSDGTGITKLWDRNHKVMGQESQSDEAEKNCKKWWEIHNGKERITVEKKKEVITQWWRNATNKIKVLLRWDEQLRWANY
jgi:hypothetical protein